MNHHKLSIILWVGDLIKPETDLYTRIYNWNCPLLLTTRKYDQSAVGVVFVCLQRQRHTAKVIDITGRIINVYLDEMVFVE